MHTKICFFLVILATSAIYADDGNTDEYCIQWNGDSCLMCVISYWGKGMCVTPLTKIDNCLQYSSETKCRVCKLGYNTNANNTSCEKIPQKNCLAVDGNLNCYACAQNIKINHFSCADESIKCLTENCEICVVRHLQSQLLL